MRITLQIRPDVYRPALSSYSLAVSRTEAKGSVTWESGVALKVLVLG